MNPNNLLTSNLYALKCNLVALVLFENISFKKKPDEQSQKLFISLAYANTSSVCCIRRYYHCSNSQENGLQAFAESNSNDSMEKNGSIKIQNENVNMDLRRITGDRKKKMGASCNLRCYFLSNPVEWTRESEEKAHKTS